MYNTIQEQKENLLSEVDKLHQRHELAQSVSEDYFEPGLMEYLDQSEGVFDEACGEILIRFEVKGTRYEGRTEQIEKVKTGDPVQIVRDSKSCVILFVSIFYFLPCLAAYSCSSSSARYASLMQCISETPSRISGYTSER